MSLYPPVFFLQRNMVERNSPWQCCDFTITPFVRSLSNSELIVCDSSELKVISFGGCICVGGQSTKSTLKPLRVLRIYRSEVNSLHTGRNNFNLPAICAGATKCNFWLTSGKSLEALFTSFDPLTWDICLNSVKQDHDLLSVASLKMLLASSCSKKIFLCCQKISFCIQS